MQPLTKAAAEAVSNLARRYGVSEEAVRALLNALSHGGGAAAQFQHPELGGSGQWMRGMTMLGDMFNTRLHAIVGGLASELAALLKSGQVFVNAPGGEGATGARFWPAALGEPSASGSQNGTRYAFFPSARRLVVERGGRVVVYDTRDRRISGVQQQKLGADSTLAFIDQNGPFTLDELTVAEEPSATAQAVAASSAQRAAGKSGQAPAGKPVNAPTPAEASPAASPQASSPPDSGAPPAHAPARSSSSQEVLDSLERLGKLHQSGVLSDDEFRAKKTELLARL